MFNSKQFEVKLQGHAIAKWLGAKDSDTLSQLLDMIRKEKWRGQLVLNYPGNGGLNDVVFTEVRRASQVEDKESLPY